MNARSNSKIIQGPVSHSTFNQYEALQDLIRKQTGVDCSILILPDKVSIRAKNPGEYYLARSVIRFRVSQPIVMDIEAKI